MAPAPRPLVLVPGACLGGWAWHDVAARLRELGHDVYPATLTGLGERAHLATPEIDVDTHVADVVGILDYEDLHDAVLVGHSYSGLVVTGAADRRPTRLNAVVYVDCSPVPDGMSLADVRPAELAERQDAAVREHGDGWRWPVPDREELASGVFGSVAGLDDRHYALFTERGTPQPYGTFTSPLHLEHDRPPGVRRAAILCADGGIDVATVRHLLAEGDPRVAPFGDPDWDLRELPTGHWPMFTMPNRLADLLHEIAQG